MHTKVGGAFEITMSYGLASQTESKGKQGLGSCMQHPLPPD